MFFLGFEDAYGYGAPPMSYPYSSGYDSYGYAPDPYGYGYGAPPVGMRGRGSVQVSRFPYIYTKGLQLFKRPPLASRE